MDFKDNNGHLKALRSRDYSRRCCADGNPHHFFDGVFCVRDMSNVTIPVVTVDPDDATWQP